MEQLNLVLSLPQGAITATNLGIEGFAWHRRPGSGKYFLGRTIFFDLALSNGRPDFTYLDEGGIYAGDKTRVSLWRFPKEIPHVWERAEG
ncbi:MAG: hypothetical protein MUO25_05655 [Thermoanaerobaculaceae bacterium]|nr:hypothetical protein [Thermoanaerobaculaceae bacterium]